MPNRSFPRKVDTAVVGGGVAGLYAGFRLCTCPSDTLPTPCSVAIFEASARFGGRLCSARLEDTDPVVDMGGMRFMRSQELLTSLVENVLSSDPLARVVSFSHHGPQSSIFHLRGRLFTLADMQDETKSPQLEVYDLPERWRGMSPDDVVMAIIENVLHADGLTLHMFSDRKRAAHAKWGEVKRTMRYRFEGPFQNRLLHEMTLSQVVLDMYGSATLQYLREGLGYDESIIWTAADMFEVYSEEFTPDEETLTLTGGLQAIPNGLHKRALKAGVAAITHAKLESFEASDNPEFRYVLRFRDALAQSTENVYANNIILALPRLALEPLQSSIAALGGVGAGLQFGAHVRCVGLAPAVKVVMWFDVPWWAPKHGVSAHMVTDLPLRQSYLFGSTEPGRRSVIIATYSDMENTTFWKALQECGRRGDKTRHGGLEAASGFVVDEVMRQLRVVFGSLADVAPVKSMYKVWDGEREGDMTACHFWQPGCKMWEVAASMRQPLTDESVFICGEAYSDRHGWVEGALCTTEQVLQDKFGLSPPNWGPLTGKDRQDDVYYLGY